MMPGKNRLGPVPTIDEVRDHPDYDHVVDRNVPCWPGGITRCVFRHAPTGRLWARDVLHDDNSSEERGDWYEVEAERRVVIDYEPIDQKPVLGPLRPQAPPPAAAVYDRVRRAIDGGRR